MSGEIIPGAATVPRLREHKRQRSEQLHRWKQLWQPELRQHDREHDLRRQFRVS